MIACASHRSLMYIYSKRFELSSVWVFAECLSVYHSQHLSALGTDMGTSLWWNFTQNLSETHKFVCHWVFIVLSNHFDILHRAQQYNCCALCKISKWLDNCNLRYEQTKFQIIWKKFLTDILHYNDPCDLRTGNLSMYWHVYQVWWTLLSEIIWYLPYNLLKWFTIIYIFYVNTSKTSICQS